MALIASLIAWRLWRRIADFLYTDWRRADNDSGSWLVTAQAAEEWDGDLHETLLQARYRAQHERGR